MESCSPRAIEVLGSTLVQLDSFAIQLLFNNEISLADLSYCFGQCFERTFRKHWREGAEEMNRFLLMEGEFLWGVKAQCIYRFFETMIRVP